jgi:hypothetical protein
LQADVHQTELGLEEVVVQDTLRPTGEGAAWPMLAMKEFDGAASFLDAQDSNQAILAPTFAPNFLDELLLAMEAPERLIRRLGLLRQLLGMIDEHLRLLFDEGQKVHAAHLEAVVDPAVEMLVTAEGKVALENDAIMAAENGYNQIGEFLREVEVRRHGVLLPGCLQLLD